MANAWPPHWAGRIKSLLAIEPEILRAGAAWRVRRQQISDHAFRYTRTFLCDSGDGRVNDSLDVIIAIGIKREIEPALVLEHGRKPGIVTPVRLDDDRALRLAQPQEVIDRELA